MLLRHVVLGFICAAVLSSCATGYTPMHRTGTVSSLTNKNEDLNVKVALQPFGENERFDDNAREYGVSILHVVMENISDQPIEIYANDIRYSFNEKGMGQPTMLAGEVRDKLGLTVWWYLAWAPLWIGVQGNDGSGFSLPIGLPIALYNIIRAAGTNNSFEAELEEHRLRSATLEPGQSIRGWIYLPVRGRDCYLLFKYKPDGLEARDFTMRYGV